MIMRRFILMLACLLPATAFAGKAEDIARVEAYLSGLTTVVADFNQADSNGGVATGKFYLKRPGKMLWKYNPPTPVQLVSDGKTIVYYDSELGQVNRISMDDTLAGFLTQKTITLDSPSAKLMEFMSKDNVIRATVIQRQKAGEGSLTLEFSDNPLQLKQMIVRDAMGQQTNIQLQGAVFGTALPDSLFVFKDDRKARRGSPASPTVREYP